MVAGCDGICRKMHTFINPASWVSPDKIYRIWYADRPINNFVSFFQLKGIPELLLDPSTADGRSAFNHGLDQHRVHEYLKSWLLANVGHAALAKDYLSNMRHARDEYFKNPHRWHRYDQRQAWERAKYLRVEIQDFGGDKWIRTYNEKYDTEAQQTRFEAQTFETQMSQVDRHYGNKPQWRTLRGDTRSSQLSRITRQAPDIEYEETGVMLHVDSMALQVAMRERHYADIFLYFGMITWLKQIKKFPNFKVSAALAWFPTFIKNRRLARSGRTILKQMIFAGLLKAPFKFQHAHALTDDTVLSIRSQSEYVGKNEAAWVATRRQSQKPKKGEKHKSLNRMTDPHTMKYRKIKHRTSTGEDLDWHTQIAVDTAIEPYFDIWANKTVVLDSGFCQLFNGGESRRRRWLYEAVCSSWDHPMSRARIQNNILISRSSQQQYERQSLTTSRRYNWLEIPDDMWNTLTDEAKEKINKELAKGGKFRRSRHGVLFRQEGNSLKSDLFNWRSSKKCARCRLSPRLVKRWQATRTVFVVNPENPDIVVPAYMPVDSLLTDGQPTTRVFKKTKMKTCQTFAVHRQSISCPVTNPEHWTAFEPLIRLDRRNGDVLVPRRRSFKSRTSGVHHERHQKSDRHVDENPKQNFNVSRRIKDTVNSGFGSGSRSTISKAQEPSYSSSARMGSSELGLLAINKGLS